MENKKSYEYKREYEKIKQQEKEITYVVPFKRGELKFGTTFKGDTLRTNMSVLMRDNFDMRFNEFINKITCNSKESIDSKINNIINNVNMYGDILKLKLDEHYTDLKIKEAYIVYEYKCALENEKIQEQAYKEILSDQLKAEKQLTKQIGQQSSELVKLQYEYNKRIKENLDTTSVEKAIEKQQSEINQNDYILKNKRSGFIYVVSNRDMLNCYKIGVTRRPDINERMNELGNNASHSFPMEVHGYVFVDEVYEKETQIHNYFAEQRVNPIQNKKEWFFTDLPTISKAFKDLFDIDINLSEDPCSAYIASKEKFNDMYEKREVV